MAGGLYIEGRKIKNFSDIQKNYNYYITFTGAGSLIGWTGEDITLRARSFSIPQRGNEAIESSFGAMKQFFPGKPTFSNTLDITFEETESQGVATFLNAWQQKIFDLNAGHSHYIKKRGTAQGMVGADGICDVAYIVGVKQGGDANGPTEEPNRYWFQNIWLQNVAEVNIDYNQAGDSVKFNCTFQFDFWSFGPVPGPTFGDGVSYGPTTAPTE